jgi:hypothetical protein
VQDHSSHFAPDRRKRLLKMNFSVEMCSNYLEGSSKSCSNKCFTWNVRIWGAAARRRFAHRRQSSNTSSEASLFSISGIPARKILWYSSRPFVPRGTQLTSLSLHGNDRSTWNGREQSVFHFVSRGTLFAPIPHVFLRFLYLPVQMSDRRHLRSFPADQQAPLQ